MLTAPIMPCTSSLRPARRPTSPKRTGSSRPAAPAMIARCLDAYRHRRAARRDGRAHGLAYSLWLPAGEPKGGVVILHGAASCKESHHDYARFVLPAGLAAIVSDQRGHGASEGPMDGRALDDVATMAWPLRERIGAPDAAVAIRGSSMGGCLAILAAPIVRARVVVAICPASVEGLRRALANRTLQFDADVPSLDAMFAEQDLNATVGSLEMPLLLLHAEGDEVVPVEHSRELASHIRSRQPPDRGPRRPSPLDPARRRAPGGQPALHRAGTRLLGRENRCAACATSGGSETTSIARRFAASDGVKESLGSVVGPNPLMVRPPSWPPYMQTTGPGRAITANSYPAPEPANDRRAGRRPCPQAGRPVEPPRHRVTSRPTRRCPPAGEPVAAPTVEPALDPVLETAPPTAPVVDWTVPPRPPLGAGRRRQPVLQDGRPGAAPGGAGDAGFVDSG